MALSTNSTLRELWADEKAKAVLEAHHPDLLKPDMEKALDISLRQIATYSGGSLTDESLATMDADLAKI